MAAHLNLEQTPIVDRWPIYDGRPSIYDAPHRRTLGGRGLSRFRSPSYLSIVDR